MTTSELANWALATLRRYETTPDTKGNKLNSAYHLKTSIDRTAPKGCELAEREMVTLFLNQVPHETIGEWAFDLEPASTDAADAVAYDQLTAVIQGQREGVAMAYGTAPSTARVARATAAFIAKHGVPPLSPTAIQAAADRAHDERTEGFSKRPFRTNHHD